MKITVMDNSFRISGDRFEEQAFLRDTLHLFKLSTVLKVKNGSVRLLTEGGYFDVELEAYDIGTEDREELVSQLSKADFTIKTLGEKVVEQQKTIERMQDLMDGKSRVAQEVINTVDEQNKQVVQTLLEENTQLKRMYNELFDKTTQDIDGLRETIRRLDSTTEAAQKEALEYKRVVDKIKHLLVGTPVLPSIEPTELKLEPGKVYVNRAKSERVHIITGHTSSGNYRGEVLTGVNKDSVRTYFSDGRYVRNQPQFDLIEEVK